VKNVFSYKGSSEERPILRHRAFDCK